MRGPRMAFETQSQELSQEPLRPTNGNQKKIERHFRKYSSLISTIIKNKNLCIIEKVCSAWSNKAFDRGNNQLRDQIVDFPLNEIFDADKQIAFVSRRKTKTATDSSRWVSVRL